MVIREGEAMPFFYGLTIVRPDYNCYQVDIIPLNLIKRLIYQLMWKVKPNKFDRYIMKKFARTNDSGIAKRVYYMENGNEYCMRCKEEISWCDCCGWWECITKK